MSNTPINKKIKCCEKCFDGGFSGCGNVHCLCHQESKELYENKKHTEECWNTRYMTCICHAPDSNIREVKADDFKDIKFHVNVNVSGEPKVTCPLCKEIKDVE